MLHGLNLNHVMTFLAVAQSGGFRSAAEQLHLTQSAVSIRIRSLEQHLGVPLFHRTTRSVKLTAEGIQLLAVAKQVSEEMERVASELRGEASLQRGQIELASVSSTAASLLPQLIADFGRKYPGIRFTVHDVHSSAVLAMVRNEEVDLGIMTGIGTVRGVVCDQLFHDEFVAIVPAAGHALSRRATVSLRELAAFPMLLNPLGAGLRHIVDKALSAAGVRVSPVHEAFNGLTLIALVQRSLGVAILPELSLRGIHLGGCKVLRLKEPVGRDIVLAHLKGRSESPAVAAFHRFVGAQAKVWATARAPLRPAGASKGGRGGD